MKRKDERKKALDLVYCNEHEQNCSRIGEGASGGNFLKTHRRLCEGGPGGQGQKGLDAGEKFKFSG